MWLWPLYYYRPFCLPTHVFTDTLLFSTLWALWWRLWLRRILWFWLRGLGILLTFHFVITSLFIKVYFLLMFYDCFQYLCFIEMINVCFVIITVGSIFFDTHHLPLQIIVTTWFCHLFVLFNTFKALFPFTFSPTFTKNILTVNLICFYRKWLLLNRLFLFHFYRRTCLKSSLFLFQFLLNHFQFLHASLLFLVLVAILFAK